MESRKDMSNYRLKPAGWCWFGLMIYVVSADTFLLVQEFNNKENYYTMSSSFRYALKHPLRRWPLIVMWLILTFHLFDFFFPERVRKFEPIGAIGRTSAKHISFLTSERPTIVIGYLDDKRSKTKEGHWLLRR